MEVEFFRQHLVSPPPVHLAKIYSRSTFISILSTYPNLQESTFLLPPVHLSEIYKKFWREHCQGGGSTAKQAEVSSYPQKC